MNSTSWCNNTHLHTVYNYVVQATPSIREIKLQILLELLTGTSDALKHIRRYCISEEDIHIHTYIHTYTHTHACTHAYMHAHTHTHTVSNIPNGRKVQLTSNLHRSGKVLSYIYRYSYTSNRTIHIMVHITPK